MIKMHTHTHTKNHH